MHKQFTDKASRLVLIVAINVLLGACSSLSFGPQDVGSKGVETTGVERDATRTEEGVGASVAEFYQPIVPTPPLKSGNQALFERALELLKNGQHAPAEVLFQELTLSQPELAGPWVNLGTIYLAEDNQEAAAQAFKQALAANPVNCDALNQLGVMARRDGRFLEAEGFYQQCIKANPGYARARLNLGILYELYMGRLGEALAAYHDYQLASAEPDSRVDGWVMDLERRVAAVARR